MVIRDGETYDHHWYTVGFYRVLIRTYNDFITIEHKTNYILFHTPIQNRYQDAKY